MPFRPARRFPSCALSMLIAALVPALGTGSQIQPGQTGSTQARQPGQRAPAVPNAPKPGDPSVAPTTPASPPQSLTPQNQAPPLPLEFESHGLIYEALTKNGITVMYAPLPPHIKDFNIIQVTVTNGGLLTWTVRPSDFSFTRQDGTVLQPVTADEVVYSLLQRASASDVIKLQLLYEESIYAVPNYHGTNGYEKRREAAMTQFVNRGLKAAVAASAITLSPTRLKPGDSTDGAVFFENRTKDKTLGAGKLVVHTCGEIFEFFILPEVKLH